MIQGRTKDSRTQQKDTRGEHSEACESTCRSTGARMARWEVETRQVLGALRSEPGLLRCEQQSDPVSDVVVEGRDRELRLSSDPHT